MTRSRPQKTEQIKQQQKNDGDFERWEVMSNFFTAVAIMAGQAAPGIIK